ncbi:MAG: cobalamin-binding protein, partial [Nitrosarchaeum sp.]
MPIKRIVSFLPSATELLYEFGVEDMLYGVTHECKYPENAKTKPRVISSVINSDELSSKEIDTKTCQLLNDGKEIFVLHEKNILEANPDLIISQETCEACAAHTNQVNKAIQILQKKPIIHSMDPHNLQEIVESVNKIGKIIEKENKAKKITESLKKRIKHVKNVTPKTKLKVLAIEWIEPFFTAGHWVPEMIKDAGGENMISEMGEHSRKLGIDEITKSDPDIIIMMPCGFDTFRIISEYNKILKEDKPWRMLRAVKNKKVFAVDANSYFSKPSI